MRKFLLAAFALGFLGAGPGVAADAPTRPLPQEKWSFDGVSGTYDRAALQRGFQVYSEVCSRCHAMHLLAYRDLQALGYNRAQIEAFAAEKEVTDGPDDKGNMFQRKALPSDRFVSPFKNEQEARDINNGALPPDLSLIIKAREGGANYVYGLMNGYVEKPADSKIPDTLYYNIQFPGNHLIAMPQPLFDDAVVYGDGTKATLSQEAHDVATFLAWAAEPKLEERHRTGVKVVIFLVILTALLYVVKRRIWDRVH
ncbi:MAG TPA: cytochrome c1 [Stellaceae bacterium]|nr:cytochrome c1 [Stellaceae bacterium]